jgi:hypothetical protein
MLFEIARGTFSMPYKGFIRNLAITIPAALLVFFTVSCTHVHTVTDYSHRTDFANYHTYSWLKVNAGNSLWADRIRRDVNTQLAAKGWQEVPSGGQAAIAAFGATREKPTLETFYNGFGPGFGGWYWNGFWGPDGYATTQTVYTPLGSLTVDIFDAHTKHLIWRGTARQALSGNPESNQHKLAHAVAKLFSNFPPQTAG